MTICYKDGDEGILTTQTYNEQGHEQSYDGNFSFEKKVNGKIVEWKHTHYNPYNNEKHCIHSIESKTERKEFYLVNGRETSIDDLPSSTLFAPKAQISEWKKNGIYMKRALEQPNVVSVHGTMSVMAWKDENGQPDRLVGPAVIITDHVSTRNYFFIHGRRVTEQKMREAYLESINHTEKVNAAMDFIKEDVRRRELERDDDIEFKQLIDEIDTLRRICLLE